MATVWNPADKNASITLSSGDHVMSQVGSGNRGARSHGTEHSTGKWYFEFTSIFNNGAGGGMFGICDSGYNYDSTSPGDVCGVDMGGYLHGTGAAATSLGSPEGNVVCFALDFDNAKFWVRYDNGPWWGDSALGDPSINFDGWEMSLTMLAGGPSYIVARVQGAGASVTINAGDSAFAYAVPTNFLGWDQPVPVINRQSLVIF